MMSAPADLQPLGPLSKVVYALILSLGIPMVVKMRFLIPALLTGMLLILAVTVSFYLSWHLDSQISCGEFVRVRGGCSTNWGLSLSLLWGTVAGLIGLIWIHFQNRY
jgi:hypothetical protein